MFIPSLDKTGIQIYRSSYGEVEQLDVNYLLNKKGDGRGHFISLVPRPGIIKFVTMVEWSLFEPGTEANDLFEITTVMWEGVPFWVLSFPIEYRMEMDVYLESCRIVAIESDEQNGRPTIFRDGEEFAKFPLYGENVWLLDLHPKHPIRDLKTLKAQAQAFAYSEAMDHKWCESFKEMKAMDPDRHPEMVM